LILIEKRGKEVGLHMQQGKSYRLSISDSVLYGKGVVSIVRTASYLLGSRGLIRVVEIIYGIALAHYFWGLRCGF